MSKNICYNVEWEDPKIHSKLSEYIATEKDDHHFSCKVCNNGSLKLGTMGVWAPVNHIKPSKDNKKKERNLVVVQKSFSISSLVGKLSAVASKDLLAVATTGQSTSSEQVLVA